MTGKAFRVIRAHIDRAEDRAAFDRWYSSEHMPRAIHKTQAEAGSRYWSRSNPHIHVAMYRFADMTALSMAHQGLDDQHEFDTAWPGMVREQEIIEQVDHREVRGEGAIAGKAFFVVRALFPEAFKRAAVEDWYASDHMPRAIERFRAEAGSRFWSATHPRMHVAMYRHSHMAALLAGREQPDRDVGPREFDAAWPGSVRSHEMLELVDHREAGTS